MPYINDTEFDALLNSIQDNVGDLHICSQEPINYTEATVTYTLGDKQSPTVAEPSDRGGGGREIVVSAITDGDVTGDGDASHWAIVKTSATTRLMAAGALSAPQTVSNGNTFTLTSFAIGVPDAA
jgi:hypothetical protein